MTEQEQAQRILAIFRKRHNRDEKLKKSERRLVEQALVELDQNLGAKTELAAEREQRQQELEDSAALIATYSAEIERLEKALAREKEIQRVAAVNKVRKQLLAFRRYISDHNTMRPTRLLREHVDEMLKLYE